MISDNEYLVYWLSIFTLCRTLYSGPLPIFNWIISKGGDVQLYKFFPLFHKHVWNMLWMQSLMGRNYHYSYFIDMETKAQRDEVIHLKSHSQYMYNIEARVKAQVCDSKDYNFNHHDTFL